MRWWSKNHIEEILGEDSDLEVNEIKERLVQKGYKHAYSSLCRYLNKIGFQNKNPTNDLMNLTTAQKEKKLFDKKYKDYITEVERRLADSRYEKEKINKAETLSKYQETLAKSHWLKPLRDCQNLLWISLLPIRIRFCSGAGKTSLSFCVFKYTWDNVIFSDETIFSDFRKK